MLDRIKPKFRWVNLLAIVIPVLLFLFFGQDKGFTWSLTLSTSLEMLGFIKANSHAGDMVAMGLNLVWSFIVIYFGTYYGLKYSSGRKRDSIIIFAIISLISLLLPPPCWLGARTSGCWSIEGGWVSALTYLLIPVVIFGLAIYFAYRSSGQSIIKKSPNISDNLHTVYYRLFMWLGWLLVCFKPAFFILSLMNSDNPNEGLVLILFPGLVFVGLFVAISIFVVGNWLVRQAMSNEKKLLAIFLIVLTLLSLLVYGLEPVWISMNGQREMLKELTIKRTTLNEDGGWFVSVDKAVDSNYEPEVQRNDINQELTTYPRQEMYFRPAQYTKSGFTGTPRSTTSYYAKPVVFVNGEARNTAKTYLNSGKMVDITYLRCDPNNGKDLESAGCDLYWFIKEIKPISEFAGAGPIGEIVTGKFTKYNPPESGNYSIATFISETGKTYDLWGQIRNGTEFVDWNDAHNPFWSLVPGLIKSGETVRIQITGPTHTTNQHIKWIYK